MRVKQRPSGDTSRSFQHQSHLAMRKRSCVVLTDAGVSFVRRIIDQLEVAGDRSAYGNGNDAAIHN